MTPAEQRYADALADGRLRADRIRRDARILADLSLATANSRALLARLDAERAARDLAEAIRATGDSSR